MVNLAGQKEYQEIEERLAAEFEKQSEVATITPEGVTYLRK